MLTLLLACAVPEADPPAPRAVALTWYRSEEAESWELALAGLDWALSQAGATHDGRTRERRFSALHRARKLFGELILDAYLQTESDRLAYQAKNQKQLRAETYAGVQAAVLATTGATVGRKVILAPSFVGGPRHYHQQYRNAMAIVRAFGKPDLFITFTCNPKWPDYYVKRNCGPV